MHISTHNTLFIGKNLITLKRVDSTNSYAKLLANSGPVPDGTVILAEEQYDGRGQAGSSWQSERGKNLTFSLILACNFLRPADQFLLSMALSLGVLEAVAPLLEKEALCIKWPNDIYAGGKKLGGLLIENILAGSQLKTSVAGIGLNINQDDFPGLPGATSIKKETGNPVLPETLLAALCQAIEARYLQLKGGKRNLLKEDYLRHLLGYRQARQFRRLGASAKAGGEQEADPAGEGLSQNPFEGVISGITPEGKLLVQCAEGLQAFGQKEISFVI